LLNVTKFRFTVRTLRAWLEGTEYDIAVLVLIAVFGFFEWYYSRYIFTSSGITHEYGIIVRQKTHIPTSSIVSVIAEKRFYTRPFKALRLYVDTCAGNIRSSDMRLLIRYRDYEEMKKALPIFRKTLLAPAEDRPKMGKIILFSALFSSSLSGTVYVVLFFIQGGRGLVKFLNEMEIDKTINEISETVSSRIKIIPPVIVTIIAVFIGLWILSFVSNCLRYANFRIYKRGRNIKINYGLFTKRDYYIDSEMINFTDIRQNLIMKIKRFSFVTLTANCPGYGSTGTQIPVFVPILSKANFRQTLKLIMPYTKIRDNVNKPEPMYFWQFLWQPCITGMVIVAAGVITMAAYPMTTPLVRPLVFLFELPVVVFIIVRIVAIFSNGVGIEGNHLTLRYCKGLVFHTILADCTKVVRIDTSQTFMQKQAGICHMYFYLESRNSKRHRIIAMPYREAKRIERMVIRNAELARKEKDEADTEEAHM
jgi:uncharacterized membrane protein YdbT with pleckstrin-like domain